MARLRVENAKLERRVDALKAELAAAQHHVAEMVIECQALRTAAEEKESPA